MVLVFRPSIGPVELSVSLSETHTHSSSVSEHPIESGSLIADHVQSNGFTLQMEAIIATAQSTTTDIVSSAASAYATLLEIYEQREAITVVTGLKVYRSMVITEFRVSRDRNTGSLLSFSAELREIRVAAAQVVTVATGVLGNGTSKLGEKGTKTADEKATASARGSIAGKHIFTQDRSKALAGGLNKLGTIGSALNIIP
jgi:hypothetical protein